MAGPVASHIPSAFDLSSGERARLIREPVIGSVIPDMLLGIWSGDMPRWHRIDSISRHVLAWLTEWKFATGEEQLCRKLFLNNRTAASAVSRLERVGAVARHESGELHLQPQFDVSESVRLIAIEMKLKRWREALDQAISYRSFSDEAYVVMDGTQAHLGEAAKDSFYSSGVGLFLYGGADFRLEVPAVRAVPAPSVNRFVALAKISSGPYCLA